MLLQATKGRVPRGVFYRKTKISFVILKFGFEAAPLVFLFLKQLKKPLREELETKRTSRWVVFERLLLVLDS